MDWRLGNENGAWDGKPVGILFTIISPPFRPTCT
jgi:hypothetical protein